MRGSAIFSTIKRSLTTEYLIFWFFLNPKASLILLGGNNSPLDPTLPSSVVNITTEFILFFLVFKFLSDDTKTSEDI